MATEVDICNLALAHLGDNATIASLKPPEGSAQAEHAAASDNPGWQGNYAPSVSAGLYVPQPFVLETDSANTPMLLTNVKNAIIRYQAKVVDPSKFSSLFTLTLSWHLASMLAGPVIKGDAGQAEAKRCAGFMAAFLTQAKNADLNNRKINLEHIVPWTAGR